jgi:hypothetical protein
MLYRERREHGVRHTPGFESRPMGPMGGHPNQVAEFNRAPIRSIRFFQDD